MSAQQALAPVSHGIMRVLVVNADVDEILRVRDVLQASTDFHVHGVDSAPEAELALKANPFDAVVVDLRLWRQDPMLAALAKDHRLEFAFVLLTRTGDDHEAAQAMRMGVSDYVNADDIRDGGLLIARLISAVDDIRAARRRETLVRWLEREARTDHLTGLHNRRAFDDRLAEVCEAAKPLNEPVSLIVADIESTRRINEAYGHGTGDEVIRRAATAIARSIRGADFASRIGGDDFGIILPAGDAELARRVARRIAHEVDRWNAVSEDTPPIALSFGVATGVGCSADALFAKADQQLSTHKHFRIPTIGRYFDTPLGPDVA